MVSKFIGVPGSVTCNMTWFVMEPAASPNYMYCTEWDFLSLIPCTCISNTCMHIMCDKQLCLMQTELPESDNSWPKVGNVALVRFMGYFVAVAYECDQLGDYQIPPLSVHTKSCVVVSGESMNACYSCGQWISSWGAVKLPNSQVHETN